MLRLSKRLSLGCTRSARTTGLPRSSRSKGKSLDAFVALEDALHGALHRESFRITIDIDIRQLFFFIAREIEANGAPKEKRERRLVLASENEGVHRYLNCGVKHRVHVIAAGSCSGLKFPGLLSQLLK